MNTPASSRATPRQRLRPERHQSFRCRHEAQSTPTPPKEWRKDLPAMLDLFRTWARFGGGSAEDIFVTFGVSEREFFHRVWSVLDDRPPPALTWDSEYASWRRIARVRLERAR